MVCTQKTGPDRKKGWNNSVPGSMTMKQKTPRQKEDLEIQGREKPEKEENGKDEEITVDLVLIARGNTQSDKANGPQQHQSSRRRCWRSCLLSLFFFIKKKKEITKRFQHRSP